MGTREDLFWAKVDKSGECWEWTAYRLWTGHGQVGIGNRRTALAHRVAWEMENGPIPNGMIVRHTCDNPPCVRVSHLELGSQHQNVRDAFDRGRRGRKLDAQDQEAVRELVDLGWTQRQVASLFGLSSSSVSRLLASG